MILFYSCCLLSDKYLLAGAQVEIENNNKFTSSMNNKSLNITSFIISTFSQYNVDFAID